MSRSSRGSFVTPLLVIAVIMTAAFWFSDPVKARARLSSAQQQLAGVGNGAWEYVGKFVTHLPNMQRTAPPVTPTNVAASSTGVFLFAAATPSATADRLFAVDMASHAVQEETVATGWRATMVQQRGLSIEDPQKTDGVQFLRGDHGWSVPLRNGKGRVYDEAQVLGLLDEDHAAVVARQGDRVLLSISRTGTIRELYSFTDAVEPLTADRGAAYLSTFTPGEGLESPPAGPSSLIRIKVDGSSVSLATEPRVIVAVLPGPSSTTAYLMDDAMMRVLVAGADDRREGRPLIWLDDHRLIFARGVSLFLWDAWAAKGERVQSIVDLPLAPVIGLEKTAGL
ncbi:MAG: hypothetical protein WCV84_01295 [Patescibacteria group bacterium]